MWSYTTSLENINSRNSVSSKFHCAELCISYDFMVILHNRCACTNICKNYQRVTGRRHVIMTKFSTPIPSNYTVAARTGHGCHADSGYSGSVDKTLRECIAMCNNDYDCKFINFWDNGFCQFMYRWCKTTNTDFTGAVYEKPSSVLTPIPSN